MRHFRSSLSEQLHRNKHIHKTPSLLKLTENHLIETDFSRGTRENVKDSQESGGDVYWPISFALCTEVNTHCGPSLCKECEELHALHFPGGRKTCFEGLAVSPASLLRAVV